MKVIIIDNSGSVSDQQLDAGSAYFAEKFDDILSFDSGKETIVHVLWNSVERISLSDLARGFRSMDTHCIIHLITDGFIVDEDIQLIDHIYVYEDVANSNSISDVVRAKMAGIIPVAYGNQE